MILLGSLLLVILGFHLMVDVSLFVVMLPRLVVMVLVHVGGVVTVLIAMGSRRVLV